MKAAAAELQFELAARLRDEISDLKKELRQMMEAGVALIRAHRLSGGMNTAIDLGTATLSG